MTNKDSQPKGKTKIKNSKTKKIRSAIGILGNIFLVVVLVVCIGGYVVSDYILECIYEMDLIDPSTIKESLTENSEILDSNGNLLETLYDDSGMRTKIEFKDIGENLIFAITAIEDKTFFEHTGFNYKRLVGAALESLKSGNEARGTSSITQQLVKNVYFPNEGGMKRKIQEAFYAIILERNLSKNQILEFYLNKISFGMQRNGVEAAAMTYFSKSAKDLDLVESAMLAGIPKANGTYAPMKNLPKLSVTSDHIIIDDSHPEYTLVFNTKSITRYKDVIYQMRLNDLITQEEHDLALFKIFTGSNLTDQEKDLNDTELLTNLVGYIHPTIDQGHQITSFFGDLIKDDAAEALAKKYDITVRQAEQRIYNGGFVIHGTVDVEMQKKLEAVYESIDFSENFGNATYSAVRTFQRRNDLSVDGIAGKNTIATLVQQTTYTSDDFTQNNYRKGVAHVEVTNLKLALNELGLMNNSDLFPKPSVLFNSDKNIINDETRKVIAFQYKNVINEEGQLIIKNDQYRYNSDDDLVILYGNTLKFYQQPDRVQVVLSDLFTYSEDSETRDPADRKFTIIDDLYLFAGYDVRLDSKYLTKVENNLIIDKSFFNEYPDFFTKTENGDLLIDNSNFILAKRGVIQPQSAFVVIENGTGELKAMIGGRDAYGQNIFNRATSPQQPGSSVKPIGVYTVAIQSREWTAASVIDDVPAYLNVQNPKARWPLNWYEHTSYKYRGHMTLRKGIEDSLNVLAVALAKAVGVENVLDQFERVGITSIDREGNINDVNPSAVALGGMTNGISPLELAGAYSTYANNGVYIKPITFTKITDRAGNIIIENKAIKSNAVDEKVAFIIQDMMRTGVLRGGSTAAKLGPEASGISVAGKTGTTSDKRDVLFSGFTPYYTATIWFGNDIQFKLNETSKIAANFWSVVMTKLHEDLPEKGFVEPEGLVRLNVDRITGLRPSELTSKDPQGNQIYQEIFLPGTTPTAFSENRVVVRICSETGLLATEFCESAGTAVDEVRRTRLEEYDPEEHLDSKGNPILIRDNMYVVPTKECDVHTAFDFVQEEFEKVFQNLPGGDIVIIRDYNLLLYNGTLKFIPVGSIIIPNNGVYDIVFPNGETVLGTSYNIQYLTNPEIQAAELNNILQEQLENEENNNDSELNE